MLTVTATQLCFALHSRKSFVRNTISGTLSHCGRNTFNPTESTCCKVCRSDNVTAQLTDRLSEEVSDCCGLQAFNPLNEICCQSTVLTRPTANAQCYGGEAFDPEWTLHCGPIDNKVILKRHSRDHECCGQNQFNTETECCCFVNGSLQAVTGSNCKASCGSSENHIPDEQKNATNKPSSMTALTNESQQSVPEGTLHCGPIDNKVRLNRNSRNHECCGENQFNTKTQCCCEINGSLQPVNGSDCKASCGSSENHIPDEQKNATDKPSSMTALTNESQPCGPIDNTVRLNRNSRDHECCGQNQFNTKTQCCCKINGSLQPVNGSDCKASCGSSENHIPDEQKNATDKPSSMTALTNESQQSVPEWTLHCGPIDNKVTLKRNSSDHECCGQNQFNTKTECCCFVNGSLHVRPVTSCDCKADAASTQPLHTHCCCDSCLFDSKLQNDEFQFPPENHYCGNDVYDASFQICCNGQSYTKRQNIHCCGTEAYDIKNPRMKCCAGTLHNLTLLSGAAQKVQCCGARLQQEQDICCLTESKQLLYSVKDGLQCCGHLYYNTSLWSCCAGKLAPLDQPRPRSNKAKKEFNLLSIKNLKKGQLCKKLKLGIVESVSRQSIVLNNVLKICGKGGLIYPLPNHFVETTGPEPCSFPNLTPGKSYFFDKAHFYVDLDHNSIHEALYFIVSKCLF